MVTLKQRFQAAVNVFRKGYPARKALPLAWPARLQDKPQWHIVDTEAYIREGFSMNSLIYAAIMYKVRATTLAPLRAYTGTRKNKQLLPDDHPLNVRIANPNDYQTWSEFHARNTVFLNVTGNVYVYVDPQSGEMHSFNPTKMYIIPNSSRPATIKGYVYLPEGISSPQDGIPFLPEDILHIKLPNPADPLEGIGEGLSPLASAAQIVDVDNMITGFLNRFFKQGGLLTGVLKYDIPLKPGQPDEIRANWRKRYGGSDNWGVGILDRGATYERVGLTFEEMGFNEVDSRSESRILGPFGVPPILIGARIGLERSTYSNYEAARQSVWEDTLMPEHWWFQVEYARVFDDSNNFVAFDYTHVPAIQRSLPRLVSAAYTLIQTGVPPNLAYERVGLDLPPIEGGDEPMDFSGRGSNQGPRADPDREGWGMRQDTDERSMSREGDEE